MSKNFVVTLELHCEMAETEKETIEKAQFLASKLVENEVTFMWNEAHKKEK